MEIRAEPQDLDLLDDVLVDLRRVFQRPGYRRRLLASLTEPFELGTVRVLRAVERHQSRSPCVADLADLLGVDPSTASRTVDRAVVAGLLARSPSEQDRRVTRLSLTGDGHEVLRRVTAARREVLAEVTASWSGEDLAQLCELLAVLREDFDRFEDLA